MAAFDGDDDFGRLRGELLARRALLADECIGGNLTMIQYAAHCARFDELGRVLETILKIRRGETLRPTVPEPLDEGEF